MSLWEYKVITSGKGGFATPALLEKFLNDLGRDEWEIVTFQTQPDNFLAFTGLARRSTQRDWTLEDAAAAAAKAEAEKLRAEFEAKFKAASSAPPSLAEERAPSFLEEKAAPDDGFRKPIDTSHDDEPEPVEEEKDEWDKLTAAEEDELPTFFEAIKPHMRRNQRGPGMSVGVDYLAKKWDQSEEDLKGALVECGFAVPEDEDAPVEYLEYDGDLYWLNVNRRGELWINTKEKPRPVFRPVQAQKVVIEEEAKPDRRGRKSDSGGRKSAAAGSTEPAADAGEAPATEAAPSAEPGAQPGAEAGAAAEPAGQGEPRLAGGAAPLPEGPALLARIRPHMRRNRRGPGGSGSASFLSRALKCREPDLVAAFQSLGLVVPGSPGDQPVNVEIGGEIWWLNQDSRGGLWINGRDKKPGEMTPADATPEKDTPAAADGSAAAEPAVSSDAVSGAEPQPLHPDPATPVTEVAAPAAPVLTEIAPAMSSSDAPAAPAPTEAAPASPSSDVPAGAESAPSATQESGDQAKPGSTDDSASAAERPKSEAKSGEKKPRRPRTRKKPEETPTEQPQNESGLQP